MTRMFFLNPDGEPCGDRLAMGVFKLMLKQGETSRVQAFFVIL